MFFEVEHLNFAWGFYYQGVMIDQGGNVYSYNPAKDSVPVLFNSDGYYTDQELQSKYRHLKAYLKSVPYDTLTWSHVAANQVTTSDYSDTTHSAVDAGGTIYSIYIYRQQIILKEEGDYTYYNESQSAIQLVQWLKTL